jgi:YD repeat-containing protein
MLDMNAGGSLRIVGLVIMGIVLGWAASVHAGTERFDYDALGRLVRHVDPSGTMTDYAYDAVGNLLEVRRSNDAGPPVVSSVAPANVRRGQSVRIAIGGNRLSGARVTTSDPELDISALSSTATAIGFTLGASPAATLGARVFSVVTSSGGAIFPLMIDPQVPALSFAPSPVTLAAGQLLTVTLTLSNPDIVAHSLSLAIANTAVASVSTASITLLPGQTSAVLTVSAIASGTTALTVDSATLGPTALGIYVSAPFAGETAAYAPPLGVFRPEVPGGGASPVGPFTAPSVGVFRPEAAASVGSLVGPFVAPNVGVQRE